MNKDLQLHNICQIPKNHKIFFRSQAYIRHVWRKHQFGYIQILFLKQSKVKFIFEKQIMHTYRKGRNSSGNVE